MEEISYSFLFTLFFHCRSFSPWWPLAFLIFSGAKFSHSSSTKNCLLCFSSLSLALCRAFYRLASMACRLLSLFLCLSLSLYSKLLDMTINLSLILMITRIRKPFLLSVLIFIDSLFSASQDAGGYAISRQNNLELHLGCYTYWLSYFTLVCLWFGRAGGRSDVRSRDYQNFSDG